MKVFNPMTIQKVEQLISLNLDNNSKIWVNPFTGILLYYKNDSKLTIHNKIALVDQLPPDFILELSYGQISTVGFHLSFFVIGFESGELLLVDNQSYSSKLIKKSLKKPVIITSISPEGNFLSAYTEDEKIFILDLNKEREVKELKLKDEIVTNIEWISESKFVYVTDIGSIHYFDLNKGKEIKTIKEAHSSGITVLAHHPRSIYTFITGARNGEIKLWDLDENEIHPDLINSFIDLNSKIISIASSFNGTFLSGDEKGVIRIFDMRSTRNERQICFLSTGERIKELITSTVDGEFLCIYESGSIKLFQGFSIGQIEQEFQTFQTEIEAFIKKIEQLPDWLVNDNLEFVLPNEIPILEKNLELASRILHPSILEKTSTSILMKENFQEIFKDTLILEEKLLATILKTKERIDEKKTEIVQTSQSSKKLEENLLHYLSNMKAGKISLDQLSLYFNTKTENILPLLQHLEKNKLINGMLKSEYSGYFFELYGSVDESNIEKSTSKELEVITCHNCGTDYDITQKSCPNCKTDSITCESCQKYIQQRQMMITCPYCKSYFHIACFETKVKIFGRCPKCRELVDFDSVIRKSVNEQRQQDKIVSGLTKLISKKNKFIKESETEDPDDALFDF